MHSLSTLLQRWKSEDVGPSPPESAEAVKHAFVALGVEATSDVLHLYRAIGGMDKFDNELWRLWPLAEIVAQEPSARGVVFSDYCLSCWEYRLRPVSANQSAVYLDLYDGEPPKQVASSLEEFFDLYVANARALLDPGPLSKD